MYKPLSKKRNSPIDGKYTETGNTDGVGRSFVLFLLFTGHVDVVPPELTTDGEVSPGTDLEADVEKAMLTPASGFLLLPRPGLVVAFDSLILPGG